MNIIMLFISFVVFTALTSLVFWSNPFGWPCIVGIFLAIWVNVVCASDKYKINQGNLGE